MDDEIRDRLMLARTYAEQAIAAGARFDYARDALGMAAVAHSIEQVGEQFVAIERQDRDFPVAHPEIPWRHVQATRHRIVHGYEMVDHDVIRGIIEIHLPELLRQIDRILGPSDEADGPQRPPS
ncbi:MAG: HepT-like ribonuclease domain-containing protein [Chloroflexota bacterium]